MEVESTDRAQLLLVGDSHLGRLRPALEQAGYRVTHVPATDAMAAVRPGVDAVILSGNGAEIAGLCRKIKERLPAPFLPVLVLHSTPQPVPEEPTAPDAWLMPDTPPAQVVARVAELLRLRRADAETVRLNAALAELAAENGLLYERARREADAAATLLRELQHRVRNNLAAIQALLVLERHRHPARPLPEALDVAIARLRSMAALQESLAPSGREINLGALATAIARGICEVLHGPPFTVQVSGDATISARAGSALAIVLNELICNARRHADARTVHVQISQNDTRLEVGIRDDGTGFPDDLHEGSGLMIVRTVTRNELGGTLELSAPGSPANIRVRLPMERVTEHNGAAAPQVR